MGITERIMNADKKIALEKMVSMLLESERICIFDLLNISGLREIESRLLIHRATEIVRRKHKIVFRGAANYLYRERTTKGVMVHAIRQARAGEKKLRRAAEKLHVAEEFATNEDDRVLAMKAASRTELKLQAMKNVKRLSP
jgi:hypothetical protein